jgi:Uma2 family endonuclease
VRDPEKKTNVTNPSVLVEVTSDSTEDYDRGEKLEHYKQIPSLQAIVIISHREPLVQIWSRADGSPAWSVATAGKGDKAPLTAVNSELDVDAIWSATVEPT